MVIIISFGSCACVCWISGSVALDGAGADKKTSRDEGEEKKKKQGKVRA